MNYQLIYNQLIERAKTRVLTCYKEKHHITPKCMGGLDVPENLVFLTGREHFLAHWLLCRIYPRKLYPEYIGLHQAFRLMCNNLNHRYKYKYKFTSRCYQEAKENFRFTEEQKQKMKDNHIGNKYYTYSEEAKQKISIGNKNKVRTNLHKENYSKALSKPILQFDLQGNFIKEWPSIKEASKYFKGIADNLQGSTKKANNYIWKYKNQPTPEYKPKYIPKRVLQIDPNTNKIVRIWDYPYQIYKELKWAIDYISKQPFSHNYKWVYEEDYFKQLKVA